jgi:hypothetical protein
VKIAAIVLMSALPFRKKKTVYNLPARNAAIRKLARLFQEDYLFAPVGGHLLILLIAHLMRGRDAADRYAKS